MSIFKKKSFWIILVIIVIIIVIVFAAKSRKQEEEEYNTITVEGQDLLQTVAETGKVISDPDLDLSFQSGGVIGNIYYGINDQGRKDNLLASLEANDQSAAVSRAQATLAAAQAALNLKLAGPMQEEINISKANVEIAQVSLETSQNNLITLETTIEQNIKNAEVALEKAKVNLNLIENQTDINQQVEDAYDNVFISLGTNLISIYNAIQAADYVLGIDNVTANDTFEQYLSIKNPQDLIDAEFKYLEAKERYQEVNSFYNTLDISSDHYLIDQAIEDIDNAFQSAEECLTSTRGALENALITFTFPQATLDGLILNIDTARTNLRAAILSFENYKQALTTAQNAYDIANQDYEAALQNLETVQVESDNQRKAAELDVKAKQSALNAAQAELSLKEADPRAVDLAGLYANVDEARANLAANQYSYQKTQIIAPVDGIVSKVEYDVGENIAAFTQMMSIITPLPKIEVDISESDIAKVELNDEAEITLDAYGDDIVFPGKVTFIEPAETEIAGVVYYKIKIVLEDMLDKDIKPGMTANVTITTDKKENVIAVPQRAIITKNGKKIVRVLKRGEIEEVEVETGLKGDANTEIISGLKEGDEVITFIKSQ